MARPRPRREFVRLTFLAGLAGLLACAKSEADGERARAAASEVTPATDVIAARASCDRVTSMSVCAEYGGGELARGTAVLAARCQKLGGTYAAGACPNTSLVGTCTLATGEVRSYYASGAVAYDAARAEKDCTSLYAGRFRPRE